VITKINDWKKRGKILSFSAFLWKHAGKVEKAGNGSHFWEKSPFSQA